MTQHTTTPLDTYRAARASGLGTSDACCAVMREHGLSVEMAADLSWRAETGKPAPQWLDEYGIETRAARDHERGAEKRELHITDSEAS